MRTATVRRESALASGKTLNYLLPPREEHMTTIAFLGELIGTMLLFLLGDGVVANVVLNRTKGQNSGWIVVTFGWAMAVFVGVLVSAPVSKAHLNPAVTIALAAAGQFEWGRVPFYILAQMIGACIGALLVWIHYKSHFEITGTRTPRWLSSAQYRHSLTGIESRVRGDRDLRVVYAVLHFTSPTGGLGSLDALPVALVVLVIGLSLGGTTGYAINPRATPARA